MGRAVQAKRLNGLRSFACRLAAASGYLERHANRMEVSPTMRPARLAPFAPILAGTLAAVLPRTSAAVEGPAAFEAWARQAAAGFDPFSLLVGLAVGGLALAVVLLSGRRSRRMLMVFNNVLAAIPNPRQVVDGEGRHFHANAAFTRFFGSAGGTIPELLAKETDDEEVREQLVRLAANARNGVSGHLEIPLRRRAAANGEGAVPDASGTETGDDGAGAEEAGGAAGEGAAPNWYYVAAHPVEGDPGSVFWVVDDITMRRQIEQVIREEQESFVDLLEHAPIGFYSVDAEGRFLFANETLAEWLGVRPVDLVSGLLTLHEVIADSLPAGTPAHVPFAGDPAGPGEVTLKAGPDEPFEAYIAQDVVRDNAGRVLRTRSVVRHLTHERAMAEALAQSERRFRRFFEEAPVGIALLDGVGIITECNDSMRTLVRVEGDFAPGTSLLDIVIEEDRAAVRAGLERVASDDNDDSGPPIEVRLAGEGETVCALFINRMEHAIGADSGFIVHFIDMTEQKSLEAQFAQSQKMQAVGQLAGGIAHDFNNLLTAMIGFSDLLLLRHRPGDQSLADVMQIKQNANRAANLVRQLLAFSRQQTLQSKVLDITNILAELTHLLRRLIGENIELKLIHGRDLGRVKADQGQLEQVIINLAVNARDAMTGGGKLTIVTENVNLDHEIKGKGEIMPPGRYTRVQVSDTGCGIAPQHLDRIFEPFFSTKEVGAGTGLGLSTVYGIVKQTGGFIFVQSREGEGTTFSIYLPHYVATAADLAAAETATEKSRDLTGVGTVLLVEDEDGVRAFSARALRNKGYDVLEARSGDAALEVLGEAEKPIDLLITDVVMPRIDGPTLVRQVRESRPDLKVIFISGYTEDAFRKRLDQDAGIHFLPKPFSLKQLAGKVKEVMRESA